MNRKLTKPEPKIRLSSLFVLTLGFAVTFAAIPSGSVATFSMSILSAAALVNFFMRFSYRFTPFAAGFWAMVVGTLWGGAICLIGELLLADEFSSFRRISIGMLMGMSISLIPVIAFALVPARRKRRSRRKGRRQRHRSPSGDCSNIKS